MSKLLFDTNFIVAYLLENDEIHQRAINLEDEKDIFCNELYITNHILDEIVTVIGQHASPEDAIRVYVFLKDNFIILNEYENLDFNERVMLKYKEMNSDTKQKVGFTDCSIIETAKLYGLDGIVSFDKAFKKNGEVEIID